MAAPSQQYCLRWNNHRSNLLTVFDELLQNEAFTDVTIAVDGGLSIKCHKMVLAACSSYFQTLFIDLPCKHPIVVLKDVKYSEIKAILEYMYRGEVNVAQEQLGGLLKVAEVLKVKGLIEENGPQGRSEEVETSMSPPPAISTSTSASTMANTARSNSSSSSSHFSPPHSTGGSYNNPYGKSSSSSSSAAAAAAAAVDRNHSRLSLPMWSLSGLPLHPANQSGSQQISPHAQSRISTNVLGCGYYDSGFAVEISHLKRKKMLHSNLLMNRDTPILRTVLGQAHADSSQGIPLLPPDSHEGPQRLRANSNGSLGENDRRNSSDLTQNEVPHSPYTDVSITEENDKQASPRSYSADAKLAIVNYVPAHKPEWKRYKQYTRDDIMSAIEAVRSGMSAVQAAKKHGVPSRTLYDKVKKLGIATSRPFRRSSNGSGASFPYGIGGNANGGIYTNALSESENEASNVAMEMSGVIKDVSAATDRDEAILDMARCSLSPVICCAKPKQLQDADDQVEDLSLARKSDLQVITKSDIKEEIQDNVGLDNGDCCDYN